MTSEPNEWLGLLPTDALLVASAPSAMPPTGAAVMPAARYRFQQVLFGFEAQVRAFAQGVRRHDRWLRFTPMPEMFASPRSLAALSDAVPGGKPGREIVHLRFGPARFARVLKGVRNIMVLVDDAVREPVDPGHSPLGQDNVLPAPFEQVLHHGARRGPLSCVDGRAPLTTRLPSALLNADLDVEAIGEDDPALTTAARWTTMEGLHVRSLAELGEQGWFAPADGDPARALPWRRALAQRTSGGFIMLPWNLAHSGSVIPDIVEKLAHRHRLASAGAWIVLFPFNATPLSYIGVAAWLGRLRDAVGAVNEALDRIFFARLTSLRDASWLRRLFPIAWLETDDPEVDWTAGRLSQLGIDLCLIGEEPAPLPHRALVHVLTDAPIRVRVSDMFGERTYATHSLSVSRLGALLGHSLPVPTLPDLGPSG